jgi:hypothetical protein
MDYLDYTVSWRDWLTKLIWEYLVTIQFGVPLQEQPILAALRRFEALVDYYWLGRGFYKMPSGERTQYIAVAERGPREGNTHVHLLLNRPPSVTPPDDWRYDAEPRVLSYIFTDQGRRRGVCPNGNIQFKRIGRDESDLARCVSYLLKNLSGPDSIILR